MFIYFCSLFLLLLCPSALANTPDLIISRTPIETEANTIRIASARSAVDLGLIEAISKEFQKNNPGLKIHISYGGVLKVIENAQQGLADVVLTHHQPGEKRFVEQGFGILHTQLMYTEYALFGPPDSEIQFMKANDIVDILRQLKEEEVEFLVPSPRSGTYMKVEELWTSAGISPDWLGYENSGASGYATLLQAAEFGSYTIAEMGTYLANKEKVADSLSVLYRGDMLLRNIYSLTVVNPEVVKGVNYELGVRFLEYLVSDVGQDFIHAFGEKKFNSMVFMPAAHLDQGLKKRRATDRLKKEKELVNGLRLVLFGMALLLVLAVTLFVINRCLKRKQMVEEKRTTTAERQRDESIKINRDLEKEIQVRKHVEDELSETLKLLRQSEVSLSEEKEKAEVTLKSIGDAVITVNTDGEIEFLNEIAEQLIGKSMDELQGKNIAEELKIIEESSGEIIENTASRCLVNKVATGQDDEHILVRGNGRHVPVIESAAPIHDRQGVFVGVVMVMHDVSNSRRMSRQLNYQATHDALTGVYNRRAFELQVDGALEEAKKGNSTHAICYIDLDNFKIVNDTCGHKEGDKLLKLFTRLMQEGLRESDMFARLGGDEFGVLLRYCDIERAVKISNELRRTVRKFNFIVGGQCFDIGISVGIVEITSDSESLSQLLSNADIACYVAKDTGGNSVYLYTPDDEEIEQRHGKMKWATRINRALENNEFTLYYQPIVTLKPDVYPYTCYELLLRMEDSEEGMIAPGVFIPAAERYALMPFIDLRNIHQSLEFLSKHIIDENTIFFINLSGQSIASEDFYSSVNELFEKYKINPKNICFEITETAVIANLDMAKRFINQFRQRGVYFALDDFGTGLSSFSYLKNLSVDFIKVDGEFAMSMLEDVVSRAMVETTIRMGETVGITIVVECVETQATMKELIGMGADYVQGFYVQKPLPLNDWESFDGMAFYAAEKLHINNRLGQASFV